jgi:2-dehydro-3-deoxygalactonokinase
LHEEKSAQGTAATFNAWQEIGNADNQKRVDFYLAIIQQHISKLAAKTNQPLSGLKLVISGMASSSIGFIDIPYNALPLPLDGSGIFTADIKASDNFDYDTLIISGVRSKNDVIRGEETQLIGCMEAANPQTNELFILPGTHSKHMQVKGGLLVGFKTYMTGDFFQLLSQVSLLKNSVEANDNIDWASFKKGVRDGSATNILHAAFKVRTNDLFDTLNKKENYHYLGGLLIGAELKELKTTDADAVNLLGGSTLEPYYYAALQELGIANVRTFPAAWVDEVVARGQLKIGKQQNLFV